MSLHRRIERLEASVTGPEATPRVEVWIDQFDGTAINEATGERLSDAELDRRAGGPVRIITLELDELRPPTKEPDDDPA